MKTLAILDSATTFRESPKKIVRRIAKLHIERKISSGSSK